MNEIQRYLPVNHNQHFLAMRTKFCFSALFLLLLAASLSAQKEETIIGSRGWGFTGVWGGYNHQYTRFDDKNVYDRGGFFTFEFGKTLLVGWSNYGLNGQLGISGENRALDMRWNTLNLGYNIVSYKAIHPIVRVDVGSGKAKLATFGEDQVFVIQPAAGIEVNVFRWLRLGAEGGYRFVQDVNLGPLSSTELSAPFAQLSLKFGYSWGRHHSHKSRNIIRNRRED
jgi:hypothetical protein